MSTQGILRVKNGKKGSTFTAIFTNAKGKEVSLPVQASAYRFVPEKAVEGDVVTLEMTPSGQIDSCTIPGKEAAPPAQKAKPAPMRDAHQSKDSRNVPNQSRTGWGGSTAKPLTDATAPYNFIPYVHEAVLPPFPTDDTTEHWSGTIRCSLKALTPLLVAGPQVKNKDGNSTTPRCFLKVNGKPVIPGSSIKGLIRSVVEVLSFSYMRPMNDKPLFWRLVNRDSYRDRFPDKDHILGGYLRKQGAEYTLVPVAVEAVPLGTGAPAGKERIKTDSMNGKKHDYMFTKPSGKGVPVLRDVVQNFFLQQSPSQETKWDKARMQNPTDGHPVFCVVDEKGLVAEIGLARFFRLRYKHRPVDVVAHEDKPDFTSHLFGTVNGECRKGKVAFESAVVQGKEDKEYKTVLGQPSPTSVAHYVEQTLSRIGTLSGGTKNDPQTLCSYEDDLNTLRLRGRKWYWHRNKDVPQPPNTNEKVRTLLKPLKEGATASVVIRVDNVTNLELGALLTALELPEGHAHKLGLGKSLGFGSVRISVESANVQPVGQRYTSLVARCAGSRPAHLTAEYMQRLRESFKKTIAEEVGKRHEAWKTLDYEALPPIKTLRSMMDYEHRPSNEITAPMSLEYFKRKAVLLPVNDIVQQQRGSSLLETVCPVISN